MSNHHDEAQSGSPTSTSQILRGVLYAFVLPLCLVIGLIAVVVPANKPQINAANTPEALAARIQKVGSVEVQAANRELKTGEQVFTAQCSACHGTGAAGSPKFKDAAAWAPRIAKGYEALLTSALKGKGNMGPQGGGAFDDVEVGRGLVYMANAAGAKFAEPKKPDTK